MKDRLISHLHIVIGTACGVLALQILGIIFAFCLCKAIGNDRDYHYKYWPRSTKDDLQQGAAPAEPQPQTKKNAAPAPPPRPPSHHRQRKEQEVMMMQWKNNDKIRFSCVFLNYCADDIWTEEFYSCVFWWCVYLQKKKKHELQLMNKKIFLKHLFFWQKYYDYLLERKLQIKSPENLWFCFWLLLL